MSDYFYKDVNQFNPTDKTYRFDAQAVYQSIINIIQTRTGERLFRPEYGIDIEDELFETLDEGAEQTILTQIAAKVEDLDNRVRIDVNKSQVKAVPVENRFELKLVFSIIGVSDQTFQIIEAIR